MGGSSKKVVVGYKYYMGVHAAIAVAADSLDELIVGERRAWTGTVTSNSQIYVDKPKLFGGDKKEGGVQGAVDVLFGAPTQPRNSYLARFQGSLTPAYRGIFSLVFRQFMWSMINPYFKPLWVRITRNETDWYIGAPWYAEKLYPIAGSTRDINPAHVLYQCCTDGRWGEGISTLLMDDAAWRAAADQLHAEGFGVAYEWTTQTSLEEFTAGVLATINGKLQTDPATGLRRLKLIRNDYDIDDLVVLDNSNSDITKRDAAMYGELINEVVCVFRTYDNDETSISVQDLAGVQAQGAVISTTVNHNGVRIKSLAARIAERELKSVSTPLVRVSGTCQRVLWRHNEGDVFAVTKPEDGLAKVAFRITSISKGNMTDGEISFEAVEDIYGLPQSTYITPESSDWEDPLQDPIAPLAIRAIETPYWELARNLTEADLDYLPDDSYAYGTVWAADNPNVQVTNYTLWSSPNSTTSNFTENDVGDFSPTGTLLNALSYTETELELSTFNRLDEVDGPEDFGYLYVDDEAMEVRTVDAVTGIVTVRRGVLDTVPAEHTAGTRVYFISGAEAQDETQHVSGETRWYAVAPANGLGDLPLADAPKTSISFVNRALRPYPPGQYQINGQYWPLNVDGALTVTWRHRDRLAQTLELVDYTENSIGPESGTTYTMRIYDGATLKRTYTGLTGTSKSYPTAEALADGPIVHPTITLQSVRDSLNSWQVQSASFERYGLGFHLGDSLGGEAP